MRQAKIFFIIFNLFLLLLFIITIVLGVSYLRIFQPYNTLPPLFTFLLLLIFLIISLSVLSKPPNSIIRAIKKIVEEELKLTFINWEYYENEEERLYFECAKFDGDDEFLTFASPILFEKNNIYWDDKLLEFFKKISNSYAIRCDEKINIKPNWLERIAKRIESKVLKIPPKLYVKKKANEYLGEPDGYFFYVTCSYNDFNVMIKKLKAAYIEARRYLEQIEPEIEKLYVKLNESYES